MRPSLSVSRLSKPFSVWTTFCHDASVALHSFLLNFVLFFVSIFCLVGGHLPNARSPTPPQNHHDAAYVCRLCSTLAKQGLLHYAGPHDTRPTFLGIFSSFHLLLHSALCAERTSNARLRPAPGGKGEQTSLVMRCRGEEG